MCQRREGPHVADSADIRRIGCENCSCVRIFAQGVGESHWCDTEGQSSRLVDGRRQPYRFQAGQDESEQH